MNHRERVRAVLERRSADRLPFVDWWGIPHVRAEEWEAEGALPRGANVYSHFGFDGSEGTPSALAERPITGDDTMWVPYRGLDIVYFDMFARPKFDADVRSVANETSQETSPEWGKRICRIKPGPHNPLGAWHTLEYPVHNRAEWDEYKLRFDGSDIDRYLRRCDASVSEHYRRTTYPVELKVPGIFACVANVVGLDGDTGYLGLLMDDPEFLASMLDFFTDFAIDLIRPAAERLAIDFASFGDAFMYDGGSWVSKAVYRDFLMPCYKRVIAFLRERGIRAINAHFGGSLTPFVPLLLETGFNGMTNITRGANEDITALKREYGDSLNLIGGIDRRALLGTFSDIDNEVERVMAAAKLGGVIPCLDCSVYYGTPYANYAHYVNALRSALGA